MTKKTTQPLPKPMLFTAWCPVCWWKIVDLEVGPELLLEAGEIAAGEHGKTNPDCEG